MRSNTRRPHSRLGYRSPVNYAAQLPAVPTPVGLRPPSVGTAQTQPTTSTHNRRPDYPSGWLEKLRPVNSRECADTLRYPGDCADWSVARRPSLRSDRRRSVLGADAASETSPRSGRPPTGRCQPESSRRRSDRSSCPDRKRRRASRRNRIEDILKIALPLVVIRRLRDSCWRLTGQPWGPPHKQLNDILKLRLPKAARGCSKQCR
jgi:hypothetical protein